MEVGRENSPEIGEHSVCAVGCTKDGAGSWSISRSRVLGRCLRPVSEQSGKQALLSRSLAPAWHLLLGFDSLDPGRPWVPYIGGRAVSSFMPASTPRVSPLYTGHSQVSSGRQGRRACMCLGHGAETYIRPLAIVFQDGTLQYNFTTRCGH